MNKTYINILCVLILGIILIKMFVSFLPIGNSVTDNVMKCELTKTNTPFNVEFTKIKDSTPAPSGVLDFDGKRELPIISREFVVFVPDDEIPGWVGPTIDICNIASLLLLAIGMIEFVRFIININHSKIFVTDNIKRLTIFGLSLIGVAIALVISGLAKSYMIDSLDLIHSGRGIAAAWDFPWTVLLLGLAGLLLSRVWARGIMLREDNELTI